MTNPTTLEDKIDAILVTMVYGSHPEYVPDEDISEEDRVAINEARHALLALLSEARDDELTAAFEYDGGHNQETKDGKIVKYSSSIRFQDYYDERIAVLRAATPKENGITQPESTGGD